VGNGTLGEEEGGLVSKLYYLCFFSTEMVRIDYKCRVNNNKSAYCFIRGAFLYL